MPRAPNCGRKITMWKRKGRVGQSGNEIVLVRKPTLLASSRAMVAVPSGFQDERKMIENKSEERTKRSEDDDDEDDEGDDDDEEGDEEEDKE